MEAVVSGLADTEKGTCQLTTVMAASKDVFMGLAVAWVYWRARNKVLLPNPDLPQSPQCQD